MQPEEGLKSSHQYSAGYNAFLAFLPPSIISIIYQLIQIIDPPPPLSPYKVSGFSTDVTAQIHLTNKTYQSELFWLRQLCLRSTACSQSLIKSSHTPKV